MSGAGPNEADAGRAAARRRHPCMRPPVAEDHVHRRVAAALSRAGAPHPDVAAAILAVRGVAGLEPEAFARRAGVGADLLARAEAGELARDELPGALRAMVPRPERQKFSSL